ncbi:MAG: hypothetical protein KDK70_10100, partial [Myxococcales bacterium]|nr:hypothetical protein [Myxococcales bacterium]
MKRSRETIVLCLLSLSVCGKASTPTPDEKRSKQAKRAVERPRAVERAAPKVDVPKEVEPQPPRDQELEASSALEYFQEDLDAASEQLAPFADGTEDPHAHLDTVKEIYESLYPLDSFVTNHIREH